MANSKPLAGLTVVSIEQAVAAPMCTARLADAGARVIKIERNEGETARHYDAAVHDMSAYFVWLNRGKQSTVFDLKNAADIAVVKSMLTKADVFVQNLAPGAVDRLGLSPEVLHKSNPRLITVGIVGYGQDTDYAAMRAYDMLVQAESGLCAVTGTADAACKVGVSVADIATGMNAHAAVLEALIERSITGKGKAIEIAMFDGLADWMNVPLLHYEHQSKETARHGLSHASIYPYRRLDCSDGSIVIAVQHSGEWHRLCCEVLKQPELETDPRFATNALRVQNRDALDEKLEPVFAAMTRAEAFRMVEDAKLASATVSSVADLSTHPALRRVKGVANGKVFSLAAPPLHPDIEMAVIPDVGEHTDDIRAEFGQMLEPIG